jgi:hypothetical protein
MDIMASKARQGKVIDLLRYTRALTVDVISDFTFGRPMGLVNEDEPMPDLLNDLEVFGRHFHIWKHFPLSRKLLEIIPESLSRKLMPLPGFFELREVFPCLLPTPVLQRLQLKNTESHRRRQRSHEREASWQGHKQQARWSQLPGSASQPGR